MNQDVSTNETVTVQPPQPTTSSKKKYESVWRAALGMILILVSFIVKKVYVFQTDPHFESVRLGNIWDICLYGLLFAVLFSGFDWLVHYAFDDLCDRHYLNHAKYVTEEDRKKRSYTLVKWGYSIAYYLVSSVWCFRILMDTTFFPVWLGGKGDPFTYFLSKLLVSEITTEMKVFYILQFGKHFSRFFGHVFIRSEGNFFQYALHHGLSVFLILYSYLTNFWLVGMMVLLLHDYSDFALIMARAYRDYRNASKKVLEAIYVHGFIFWVGCRIILFNYTCIFPAVNCILQGFPSYDQFQLSVMGGPHMLMTFMMVMLEMLQLFWTYYIAESFISVKVSPAIARHSYD